MNLERAAQTDFHANLGPPQRDRDHGLWGDQQYVHHWSTQVGIRSSRIKHLAHGYLAPLLKEVMNYKATLRKSEWNKQVHKALQTCKQNGLPPSNKYASLDHNFTTANALNQTHYHDFCSMKNERQHMSNVWCI